MRKSFVLCAASSALAAGLSRAVAANAPDFAIFGSAGVTLNGTSTVSGIIGSNADINLTNGSTIIAGLQGFGNFNGSGDFQTIAGAAVFNGNVSGGALSSYGSVDAGGNAALQGSVTGNVTVAGNLSLSTFRNVSGNALVGGSTNLSGSNSIIGTLGVNGNLSTGAFSKINNLILNGTLTQGGGTTIGNQTQGTVAVNPQRVSLVPLPIATSFVSGGTDQALPLFAKVTLAPGHYGALTFNGSNTLALTAGNYYFNSIQSLGSFTTLNLNLSGGAINIFVAGNVDLEDVSETVNGTSFTAADPTLASNVFLEAHGAANFDSTVGDAGSEFFGTVFDPGGSITGGRNETFVGSLVSSQSVTIGSANVTYEPSPYLASLPVPEPATGGVLLLSGLSLLRRRLRFALCPYPS